MLWCRDVKKVFLLNQYDEWKQYLSSLNAELANASGRDLQDGHDVHLKP